MDQEFWDDQYRERGQRWSGRVNGGLRVEVAGMQPGRALDIGCGEGADAIWLANNGWQVTAIDISTVALERARAAAGTESRIDWQYADPRVSPPPRASFDLVSAQYFPIQREPEHATLRGLLDAVANGGILLVVSHLITGPPPADWQGPDPGEFYQPPEIAAHLDDHWSIEVNESRPRVDLPVDNPHHEDLVLRARRLA
ncbi:methyltransferase family protein [Tamaricihabitans halophyticus]|uniref:Methyltransferase family protein n=1 Tax=Tamaricihabitans halophyticus TaxID=1262583 RepID=A0A4R2QW23_9PSEU|nr:class I SAM-dependent methyltransferase [Tamaricihabitans halophyticus]TCP53454.1 methyltransferase family protein [Tamaricihabitans halophyticus]